MYKNRIWGIEFVKTNKCIKWLQPQEHALNLANRFEFLTPSRIQLAFLWLYKLNTWLLLVFSCEQICKSVVALIMFIRELPWVIGGAASSSDERTQATLMQSKFFLRQILIGGSEPILPARQKWRMHDQNVFLLPFREGLLDDRAVRVLKYFFLLVVDRVVVLILASRRSIFLLLGDLSQIMALLVLMYFLALLLEDSIDFVHKTRNISPCTAFYKFLNILFLCCFKTYFSLWSLYKYWCFLVAFKNIFEIFFGCTCIS